MSAIDFIVAALLLTGAAFSLIASIGVVRMPDLYTRMQAATKAGTLGVACVILAAGVHFGTVGTAAEAVLVVIFLVATAPIASHLIARASYNAGVPLWRQTVRNDLASVRDGGTPRAEADSEGRSGDT